MAVEMRVEMLPQTKGGKVHSFPTWTALINDIICSRTYLWMANNVG